MAVKKYAKKAASYAGKQVKKRYVGKRGFRLTQIAKDVMILKSLVNVEKKFIESNVVRFPDAPLGQVTTLNETGMYAKDITPLPTQGIGQNQRTGNEWKMVSLCLKGQVRQQGNNTTEMKVKIFIIKTNGPTVDVQGAIVTGQQFLSVNPISQVIDYNSTRNVDFFKNYRVMKVINITLPADQTSDVKGYKDFQYITKLSHHVKMNKDSNTVIANGQIILIAVADSGNTATVTSNLSYIPVATASSGANLSFYTKSYYVDN